jgi:dephospho-CoA kinase
MQAKVRDFITLKKVTQMVIALTGSIASGKSTAAQMLKSAQIPVIDADLLARELTKLNSPALKEIGCNFKDVLNSDGSLDRKKLAQIVFNDPKKLTELENILHPKIEDLRKLYLSKLEKDGYKNVVYVAPLIFEKKLEKNFDKVILITASLDKIIKRIEERDGLGIIDAKKRIDAQMSDEKKRSLADVVIENNGSLLELYQKLTIVFKKICGITLPPTWQQ